MQIKDIDYILEIAKYQSISHAAEALFISQPALSRYLAKLEQELGSQLFIRDNKTCVLTQAGKIYVEFAASVKAGREKMLGQMESQRKLIKNIIQIGYTLASNPTLFYRISHALEAVFPDCKMEFIRVNDKDIEARLTDGSLHFALSTEPLHEEIVAYYNCFDAYILIVVPQSILLDVSPIIRPDCPYPWVDIKQLSDYPFTIADKNCRIRKQIDFLLERLGVTLTNIPITTDNTLTALHYTAEGQGICISSEIVIRHVPLQDKCHFFCFGEPPAIRKNGIMHLKDKRLSKQEEACLNLFRTHYAQWSRLNIQTLRNACIEQDARQNVLNPKHTNAL